MYLIINNKVIEKVKILAFLSFLGGLVFVIGLIIFLASFFSSFIFVEQLSKITTQMNLLGFFVSALYLFKPNHKLFTSNLLIVFATIMFWFVGLGFWLILFPVYYINLGDLLIQSKDLQWYNFSLFYAIWNHTVTPVLFLLFFFHMSRKSNLYYLTPVNIKSIFFILGAFSLFWVSLNILISFSDNVFPTYGILTNFNPYTKFSSTTHETRLFSIKYLIVAHIACLVLSCALTLFFSTMSIKFGIANHYRLTSKILKGSTKSIKGFS